MFLTYFWDWTIITADFNFIAKCFQLFLQVIFPFLLHPLVEIFRTEFLILTSLFQYAIPISGSSVLLLLKPSFSLDGRLNGDNVHCKRCSWYGWLPTQPP